MKKEIKIIQSENGFIVEDYDLHRRGETTKSYVYSTLTETLDHVTEKFRDKSIGEQVVDILGKMP